jgi:hypothetical protein
MVIEQLERLGIRVRNQLGEQRTQCPQCSANRHKKRDRCLAVRVDSDGAQFHCWHCDWAGGVSADERRNSLGGKQKHQRGDFGAHGRRLRYGVLS